MMDEGVKRVAFRVSNSDWCVIECERNDSGDIDVRVWDDGQVEAWSCAEYSSICQCRVQFDPET
jgi:hypothetical protein